jgi:4'-phosphopantetheinyl transferase
MLHDAAHAPSVQEDRIWFQPPRTPDLGIDVVHVWRANLDRPAAQLERFAASLSNGERVRAGRLLLPVHRNAFVAARGILRELLAGYLGDDAPGLRFVYGPYGKPALDPTLGDDLTFNVSHSHGLALIAVARQRRLGIDAERIRTERDWNRIAERFFAPDEVATLRRLLPQQRERAFFACWTRKEAFLKATGEGIRRSLRSFEVSIEPGAPAQLIHIDGDRRRAEEWCMQDVNPDPAYAAALAVEGHGWRIACYEWPPLG